MLGNADVGNVVSQSTTAVLEIPWSYCGGRRLATKGSSSENASGRLTDLGD